MNREERINRSYYEAMHAINTLCTFWICSTVWKSLQLASSSAPIPLRLTICPTYGFTDDTSTQICRQKYKELCPTDLVHCVVLESFGCPTAQPTILVQTINSPNVCVIKYFH